MGQVLTITMKSLSMTLFKEAGDLAGLRTMVLEHVVVGAGATIPLYWQSAPLFIVVQASESDSLISSIKGLLTNLWALEK